MATNGLTFVNRIIRQGLRLGGVIRDGAIPTGAQTEAGIDYLNQILAQWGNTGQYIFFLTNLRFRAIANQGFYFIGQNQTDDVKSNPFTTITSFVYKVGNVTYTPEWLSKKEFDMIVYGKISAYPSTWSYQVNLKNTEFCVYPRTTGQEEMILTGQQRLSRVDLFEDSSSEIPDYASLALAYSLAPHLANHYNGVPAAGFENQKMQVMLDFLNANQNDFQINARAPFSTNKFSGRINGSIGGGNGAGY